MKCLLEGACDISQEGEMEHVVATMQVAANSLPAEAICCKQAFIVN